jgi:uncharacterized protein YggE
LKWRISALTDVSNPLLSVRSEARQAVAPDFAELAGTIAVSRPSKLEAVRDAASMLERLTADVAELGGVPLAVLTDRSPLTWSAHSTGTHIDREKNKQTGRPEATGQIIATVGVGLRVRALELLDRLGALLAGHDTFSLHNVSWHVDDDNPAWPLVRAAAIRAAAQKARDYAAALGGSVLHVEHIADAGLLSGGDTHRFSSASGSGRLMSAGGDVPEAPSLDPVPRELVAVIEARFTASGVSFADTKPGAE